jgi:hypothetical protein
VLTIFTSDDKSFLKGIEELTTVVRIYVSRHFKFNLDMFDEQVHGLLPCDGLLAWNQDCHLVEYVYNNQYVLIAFQGG